MVGGGAPLILHAQPRVYGGRRLGPERAYAVDELGRPYVRARGRWRFLDDHLRAVMAGELPPLRFELDRRATLNELTRASQVLTSIRSAV